MLSPLLKTLVAPTGSGKTVLFELAIIRLLMNGNNQSKCVYMAPTKVRLELVMGTKHPNSDQALCSEKFRSWVQKLQPLGIKCRLSLYRHYEPAALTPPQARS